MTNILPIKKDFKTETSKTYSEYLKEAGLEEIIWKGGKFIRKEHIVLENAPALRTEALGNPDSLTGLTNIMDGGIVSRFVLNAAKEQALEKMANAYALNSNVYGFKGIEETVSIQFYHIAE